MGKKKKTEKVFINLNPENCTLNEENYTKIDEVKKRIWEEIEIMNLSGNMLFVSFMPISNSWEHHISYRMVSLVPQHDIIKVSELYLRGKINEGGCIIISISYKE